MRLTLVTSTLAALALIVTLAGADPKSEEDTQIFWPVTLIVGADQAVVCNDHLFLEGDLLEFSFRADTLWCNGLVWSSYTLPRKKPATSKEALWLEELRTRYEADTTGTSEDRIRRALSGMEEGVLDPASIQVHGIRMDAEFMDGVGLIMYFEDPMPKVVPREAAAREVTSLRRSLTRGRPFYIVKYPKSGSQGGGVRIVRAFERAQGGELNSADRALLQGQGLKAIEAINERAKRLSSGN